MYSPYPFALERKPPNARDPTDARATDRQTRFENSKTRKCINISYCRPNPYTVCINSINPEYDTNSSMNNNKKSAGKKESGDSAPPPGLNCGRHSLRDARRQTRASSNNPRREDGRKYGRIIFAKSGVSIDRYRVNEPTRIHFDFERFNEHF